ncbi:class-II fumarase/aspartase family protein [Enterocloster lavalensis]|uniref:class-II fumarase/aspartase family protein n=1 Tax=Enterocloster lavalensis TaxID=460384 RepID=UPI000D1A917B|nr:adenylosuccinate lyase family protein [Enterocloster lavalensis]PST33513.1 adenylosuccinate lyase [Enterocloster lavalensis]
MARFENAGTSPRNYGSIDVAEGIFSGEGTLQSLMDVEAALALAEAEAGVIPVEAAEEISRKAKVSFLNEETYEKHRRATGHSLMGLIRSYQEVCENGAGQYVHFGTTTQDVTDTALALQMKAVYDLVERKMETVIGLIRELAVKYRSLIMIGRTNDQQAVPITLGYKLAMWLDELERDLERLKASRRRVLVGQFGGAVGTMASLGGAGLAVRDNMMVRLGLEIPKIAWYNSRDRHTEYVTTLAMICGTLGKLGNEVYIGQKTEVNEMAEGFSPDKVGSSTMPHKRNPFVPARLSGFGRMARSIVVDAYTVMESTNERDTRSLRMEPYFMERISSLTDAALDTATDLFTYIEIREKSFEKNLNILGGLIYTEALMMHFANKFGRIEAHDILHDIAQEAVAEGKNFVDKLLENAKVMENFTKEELLSLMNPAKYIGLSEHFTDVVTRK